MHTAADVMFNHMCAVRLMKLFNLEVATPTPRPLSGRGYHALTWRSHGHSLAAYL